MSADSFPSNQQSAEAVVPCVGALHYPAPGLAVHAAKQGLLAAPSDVRRDPARTHGGLCVSVVVPLVQAEMLRSSRPARCPQNHSIKDPGDEPLVVNVRAGDLGGQRDASAVRQDVTLDAALRAIRGVRAREVPPFGAFTMAVSSEDHFHWIPRLRS